MLWIVFAVFVLTLSLSVFLLWRKNQVLQNKLSEYSKYEVIKDVESHSKKLALEAEELVASARNEAENILDIAKRASEKLVSDGQEQMQSMIKTGEKELLDARVNARKIQQEIDEKLADIKNLELRTIERVKDENKDLVKKAQERADSIFEKTKENELIAIETAKKILENANKTATEIDSSLLHLNKEVEELKSLEKALKNSVEKYKEDFFLPTSYLLDELVDGYSHTEAGRELKASKEASHALVKNGLAADNDYSEQVRRKSAIDFVLDAFNGKADSLLSELKSNNYGLIQQRLKDSFSIINEHGAAFRNARILEVYLNSRLEEIRCAAVVLALRDREREEQKALKEQMRDEAKAQREIDRVLREAEDEERKLNKLMREAQERLAKANEEERQMYEMKLAELQIKLSEAEEKNKRALSLAQQTKRGNVYIISNIGSFGENIYKIGLTRRLDPLERIDELSDASVPFDFDVHAIIPSDDAPALEKELHKIFEDRQVNKVNPRKEFFKLPIGEIKMAVESKGVNIHWTMSAEAKEYRESLYLAEKKSA